MSNDGSAPHTVLSRSDTPERVTITLLRDEFPYRLFCFVVEAKDDGRWYWTTCACDHASYILSGIAATRLNAIGAAESAVRDLNQSLHFMACG